MRIPNLKKTLLFLTSKDAIVRAQAIGVVAIIVVVAIIGGAAWYNTQLPAPKPTPNSTVAPPVVLPCPACLPTSSSEWTLKVDGFVRRPLNLSLEEIAAMPRSTVDAEIYCLPSPSSLGVLVDEGKWTGVRLGLVLEKAGVSPEAVKVAFYAEDGFMTDLTVTAAMREDIILAYEKDGEPLPEKLRLVTPGMWGYKWIKWLFHIELMDYDFQGTYERRGFPDDAEIPE